MNQNNKLDKLKNYFTPEDFYLEIDDIPTREFAASIANAKLAKLIESWPVIYQVTNSAGIQSWLRIPGIGAISKARLAFIQPIEREPCKHTSFSMTTSHTAVCSDCHVELVADWRAK